MNGCAIWSGRKVTALCCRRPIRSRFGILDGSIFYREIPHRLWCFFVSNRDGLVAAADVAPVDPPGGGEEYEFLALREGELITASVRAFSRANGFFRDTPGMAVTTLKLPALGATFFWFQRLERERHRVKWAMEDWLLPLSPAIRGFDAAQPEPMPKGVELLHREARLLLHLLDQPEVAGATVNRPVEPDPLRPVKKKATSKGWVDIA